jgi:transposase-like protein
MKKRKRHSPEEVIRKLREAEALMAGGKSPAEAAKALGVSEATFNRWRNQYGGMKGPEMKRLKELERENTRLKRLVAEQALAIVARKDNAEGNF